ncbi:MAG: Na+/H+ antiporter [Gemmataceae bacterium]|nr:Na+/H+ antiporter [Gemmataceae bacterium]
MAHPVELILALLGVAVALGVLAEQVGIPYPILLVVGGLVLSLQPWTPDVQFDPKLVFLLFLPPLLYAGAFRTEWPVFRLHLRAITLLAVGLVLFTTTLVAAAAHYWLELPWSVGFVLGALVSPPDAVAAIAVLQRVKVPRVAVTILEGESLVNDATALVTLRVAVGAAAGAAGAFDPWDAGGEFALAAGGGVLIGLAGGWAAVGLHNWLDRRGLAAPKVAITLTLLTPYAVYLPAEHLHLSGVLAAVAAGLWVGNRCEQVFRPELYEEARAVWEWVEFLLNSLIFILIGLLLRTVLEQLDGGRSPTDLVLAAAGVSLVVVAARLAWVFPGAYLPRWLDKVVLGADPQYPSWRAVVVVGWTGMRGVVSLAAALALPPFRERGLIQFLTFWVVFATLVGQGLTLPLVIRLLGVGGAADPSPRPPLVGEGAGGRGRS